MILWLKNLSCGTKTLVNKMNKLITVFLLLLSFGVHAGEVIKVGVYEFPPYVFVGEKATGITVDMIGLMNKFQKDYQFEVVTTTPQRRYKDFDNKKFDMLLFESKGWGWLKYPVAGSLAFLKGAEHYVALKKPGRGQAFFGDFKNKKMIGMLGYHYGFARFHAEADYLKKNYNMTLTDNQQTNLDLILNKRGDIAVMSKAYLNYYFKKHPKQQAKFLVSDKPDQIYRHTALVRKGLKSITVRDINKLLQAMKTKGVLTPLWKKHGLE